MNVLRRLTLAIALAVWVATPVVNGMGEGGGGTGVWVLPRSGQFGSSVVPGTSPRQTLAFANPSQNIRLVVSEMGAAVATLTEESTSLTTPLAVVGAEVVIPSELQQTLINSSCTLATIVIVDAAQLGYYIHLVVLPGTGGFELRIY